MDCIYICALQDTGVLAQNCTCMHAEEANATNATCPCRENKNLLRGGDCIAQKPYRGFGTLGYFVRKGIDVGILSNFHVVGLPTRRITHGFNGLIVRAIAQANTDYVATTELSACNNLIDAGYAKFCGNPPARWYKLKDGSRVTGTRVAQCWDPIKFCGCNTGIGRCANGVIHSVNWCGLVSGKRFDQQIMFSAIPRARPGDSGSLLVHRSTNLAVGLVFGGNTNYALANPIAPVLQFLGISLAV